MDHDIDDEIDAAIEHYRSIMPAGIKELIAKLNTDLYGGPSYYDPGGNECSCFDGDATPFAFASSLRAVRAWLDDIEDVNVEVAFDEATGVSEYDRVDGSAREIIRALVGKELVAML